MTASFHVAATGTETDTSATDTITLPGTLSTGDLMIIGVTTNDPVSTVSTPNTTFTRLAGEEDTANSLAYCEVWYGYAASGDAGAVCTVTCSGASYPAVAFASYSNAAVSSPIDSFGMAKTNIAGDSTTIPMATLTTANANVLPVSVVGLGAGTAVPGVTPPSGYTIRSEWNAGYESVAIADAAAISTAGTGYGGGTWGLAVGGGGVTVTFAISPVSGASPITMTGSVAMAGMATAGSAGPVVPITSTGHLNMAGMKTAASAINGPAVTSIGSMAMAPMGISGATYNPVVQKVSGSTTGTSLTLTLPKNTTVGNSVVIAVSGYHGGTLSNITLGGVGTVFTESSSSGTINCAIWTYTNVQQASETIVITASAAGIMAYVYELDGSIVQTNSVTLDKAVGKSATSASWSSGATGTIFNASEFVLGLAASVGGGTMHPPTSGGWLNETPFTSIAGAATMSSVAGTQLPVNDPTTFTYAGTSDTSAVYGATVATFLLMPTSTIWAGYIFRDHPAYTGIAATFTVPTVTGTNGDLLSAWVGGGGPAGGVLQCGIYLAVDSTKTGDANCRPWSWWLVGPGGTAGTGSGGTGTGGGSGETWNQADWPIKAGDSLTLSMTLDTNYMYMTITNHTEGWTYTENKSMLSLNIGFNAWSWPLNTVEVIIENENAAVAADSTLPNFGTMTFTNITTTPPIASQPQPLASLAVGITEYPEPFTLSGTTGAFSMAWVARV